MEVAELDAAGPVLAGQHAESEEDEEQGGAEAGREHSGDDRDHHQGGADQDEFRTEMHDSRFPVRVSP